MMSFMSGLISTVKYSLFAVAFFLVSISTVSAFGDDAEVIAPLQGGDYKIETSSDPEYCIEGTVEETQCFKPGNECSTYGYFCDMDTEN